MDEQGLGRRLQEARLRAGMTQQQLCQHAGLSYSTLTKIERGAIKSPSIFTIQSIATALSVTLDTLLGATAGAVTHAPAKPQKVRSKSGIEFVYFDINGCLVRFFHRAFTQLAAVAEVPEDIVEAAFWHYNDKVCRGDMTLDDFNQAMAKRIGLPMLDWEKYYLEAVEPIAVMQDTLRWAAEHYRIGLLSNIMPGFVELLRQRELIPDVAYEVIIESPNAHAIKPEVAIFKHAAEQAHCSADRILFVDDSRTNLMAAEKQGWHVLWFDEGRAEESAQNVRLALALPD